jgi:nucleoside-diphosphate kinase
MIEQSLVLIKPEAVTRGLIGQIVGRFEARQFRIVAMKMETLSRQVAETHYGEHRGKPFFEGLVSYITSGPVVAMVVESPGVVSMIRTMVGATDAAVALPGTIRGDLAQSIAENVIHASDSPESAAREIKLFFSIRKKIA